MSIILPPQPWTRQPQIPVGINRGNPLTRRLERAINLSVLSPTDMAGGAPITYVSGATFPETVVSPQGKGLLISDFGNNGVLSTPAWTNVTSEGTFALIAQRASAGDNTAWEMGNSGQADHFPFSSLAYFDVFWSSRWGGGVAAPSGATFADPVVLVFCVKDGDQRAYWNGQLWTSATGTGGWTLPATLTFAVNGWRGNVFGAFAWSRALSGGEAKNFSDNPWQLFARLPRRIFVGPAAAGGGSTGTVAYTNANDTSSAAGTTTVVGTLAKTNSNDASTASGTTTVTGTLAKTNANDTSVASGSPIVNGSLARTNANDTVVASGAVGNVVSGSVSYTNANDTSVASGTTTVVGTLARTNANDTSVAAGTTTVTGTLARTNANDTVVASGVVGSITGTLATTNANDIVVAAGWAGRVTGTVAYTNANDVVVASGICGGQKTKGGIQRLKETKVKKRDESVRNTLRDIIDPPAAEMAQDMREDLAGDDLDEAIETQVEAFVAKQEGVQEDPHEMERAKRARRRSSVLRLLMLD